jgi:hypothetical protein
VAITVVQTKVISGALSGNLTAATTVGNTLFIAFVANGTGSAPSISGVTLGGVVDNFSSEYAVTDAADSYAICAIWMDADLQEASTAVAVAGTNLNDGYLFCVEVAGMGTSPTLDKTSEGPIGAGTATWTSDATATLTQASEFAIGCTGHGRFSAGDTLTGPGTPWVNGADYVWADGSAIAGYQITTTTGAVTYSGTSVDNDYYVAIVATFIPSAGSTGAAALTGSGTISGSITLPEAAALSGIGSLGGSAVFTPTAGLSGSGSLLAGTNPAGAANLSGSGSVTGAFRLSLTAALSGSGTITPRVYLYSNLSGSGTLTAAPYNAVGSSLTGSGSMAITVKRGFSALLSGIGSISQALPTIGGTFVFYVINNAGTAWAETTPFQIGAGG